MQITGEEASNHLKELAAHDTSVRAVVSLGSGCSFALIGKLTYSDLGFCVANKEAELSFSCDPASCNIDLRYRSNAGFEGGDRSSICVGSPEEWRQSGILLSDSSELFYGILALEATSECA
jgi:hypothetical protein